MREKIKINARIWKLLINIGADQLNVFNPANTVCRGINMLCLYLIAINIAGCFVLHFIVPLKVQMACLIESALLAGVIWINYLERFETATVVFYLVINISTLYFNGISDQTDVVILMYFFLLALIFFVFEKAIIRLVCLFIILVRISFFILNYKYLLLPGLEIPERGEVILHWASDGILSSLILFTFFLYGAKQEIVGKLYAYSKYVKKSLIKEEELNEKKNLLFQDMTHDVRVAYFSVGGLCAHLKHAKDNGQKLNNMENIIDELMDSNNFFVYNLENYFSYAKFKNGSLEDNHFEETDITTEIQTIVDLHVFMAKKNGISIKLFISDDVPAIIICDKIKVIRICLNLLTNAIKFTPSGKAITIEVTIEANYWRLMVANEGVGLNESERMTLFDRKQKGDNQTAENRKGLGLAITRELIETMGGNISVSSKEYERTSFYVLLPLHKVI